MNIYAFIPSRTSAYTPTTIKLFNYLSEAGVKTKSIVGKDSIFSAFKETFNTVKPNPEDIIILCHDDIEVITNTKDFIQCLVTPLEDPKLKAGFIGVAGTTRLESDAVWWNHTRWGKGLHSGFIFHGKALATAQPTYYGPCRSVVVLDGVFLAVKARVLEEVLDSPIPYKGKWDFYDLHYTLEAWKLGYNNTTVPIVLLHNSIGELAGRESWETNRLEFIKNNTFPIYTV